MTKPPHQYQLRRPKSGRTNLASCIVATIFLIFLLIVILIVFFTVFKPKDLKISVNAVQLPSFSVSNNTVNFTFSQYVSLRNPNRASFSHYDSSLQLVYSGSQVGFMFIPAGQIDAGQTKYMAASFSVMSFPLSFNPQAAVNVAPAVTFGPGGLVPGGGRNGVVPGFGSEVVKDGEENGVGPGFGSAGQMPGGNGVVPGFGSGGGNGVVPGFGSGGGNGVNPGFGSAAAGVSPLNPPGGGRVGPTMEIESRIRMVGRVRVLNFFTHHVEAKSGCRVAIAVTDGSVLGFHC
ncbi:hypothetical protein LINGRAHAP2_LOCUS25493 [Linum grandiflorum]